MGNAFAEENIKSENLVLDKLGMDKKIRLRLRFILSNLDISRPRNISAYLFAFISN